MAATVTRRALRRARLGGRHTYRAAARHRVALAVVAAAAVLTVGSAVAASPEPAPAFTGPPSVHLPMHGPMPDGPPGWTGRHWLHCPADRSIIDLIWLPGCCRDGPSVCRGHRPLRQPPEVVDRHHLDLDASGQIMINVGYAPTPVTVRLRVDILGYFDGQPANAESTLLLARIYDSGVAPQVDIPAGATVDVPVNGVQGVPAYSASISGVTLHFETGGAWDPAGGSLIAWPSDATMPTAPVVTHGPGSAQSDLAILRPGPDGKIKIKNSTPSGSLRVLIDVQGYFTNTENLPPAVGLNPVSSGSRASAQIDGGRYGN